MTILNRGRVEDANLSLQGDKVSVRNEGTFRRDNVQQNNARFLNLGVIEAFNNFTLTGSACITNDGIVDGGKWHLLTSR